MRGCMTWFSFGGSCAKCTTAAAEQAVTYVRHKLFPTMPHVAVPCIHFDLLCLLGLCSRSTDCTWHVMPSLLDRQGHNRV